MFAHVVNSPRLHRDFKVVSVLEQLETGLEVLECLLPSYFKVLLVHNFEQITRDTLQYCLLSGFGKSAGQDFSPPQC